MFKYENNNYYKTLAKKLEKEIDDLHHVYNNGEYYDTEGLFFEIREKQNKLRTVEEKLINPMGD